MPDVSNVDDADKTSTAAPSHVRGLGRSALEADLSMRAVTQWLVPDAPHRHNVMRLRASSASPSARSTRMPPVTDSGPFSTTLTRIGRSGSLRSPSTHVGDGSRRAALDHRDRLTPDRRVLGPLHHLPDVGLLGRAERSVSADATVVVHGHAGALVGRAALVVAIGRRGPGPRRSRSRRGGRRSTARSRNPHTGTTDRSHGARPPPQSATDSTRGERLLAETGGGAVGDLTADNCRW